MRTLSLALVPSLALSLAAQSNAIPGTDIAVYEVGGPSVYGRVGPAYPNGTVGVVIGHSMCNNGTVPIPWLGTSGGQMLETYPKIAFLLARESDGRMVQISGKSHMKHSRVAFNFSGSNPCGTCQSGPSNHFRIGCYDVYSAGFNGNQSNLGPTTEINPWLGSWNPVGSYFDIGDPAQTGYPQPADGVQSLSTSGFDVTKNRMQIPEKELIVPGQFYGQNHVVILGEPVANRANNVVSRPVALTWNGASWSIALQGTSAQGSVLQRWSGATVNMAGNGLDDGRFEVAVKVTGPVQGMWHYEYAVHNYDNHRGGAALRIPMCATARVANVGFHDIDADASNDWTMVRSPDGIEFQAGAGNPLDWNTLYNFWFDSDAAPVAGPLDIVAARPGPGASEVVVPSQVPGFLGTEYLGAGCGSPAPQVWANSAPTSPNAGFSIDFDLSPSGVIVAVFGFGGDNLPLGGGCTQYLDGPQIAALVALGADANGRVSQPIPLPAAMTPIDWYVQAFEVGPTGPVLGFLTPSNGIRVRVAGTGCP